MKLDESIFSLSEVGSLAGISDLKLAANWTDRGLVDPHAAPDPRKRGRGRQRLYSARDVLRFVVMKDLSDRYAVPVPLGRRICENVLGDLNPKNPGIFIVEMVTPDRITTHWCADVQDLARCVSGSSGFSTLLVNTERLAVILKKVETAVKAKLEGKSNG